MLLPITNLLLPFLLTPTTTIPQLPSTYDSFSSKYDVLDGGSATEVLGINAMRAKAASFVKGNVLEVAVGTGLESTFYDWKQISRFTGVDNSEGMLSLANQRIPALAKKTKVDLRLVDVTKGLDFSNDEFDTVVDTFSMCVIEDPLGALTEMRRVVKADGVVVLLENSISTNPILAQLQDLTEPLITPLSKNCRWNVNVPTLAAQAGLIQKSSESIQAGTILLQTFGKGQSIP